jgi:hypothetical protein
MRKVRSFKADVKAVGCIATADAMGGHCKPEMRLQPVGVMSNLGLAPSPHVQHAYWEDGAHEGMLHMREWGTADTPCLLLPQLH